MGAICRPRPRGASATVARILNARGEIGVIWSAEWRRALRSGRTLVLLGLYALFSLLVLRGVASLAAAVQAQVDRSGAGSAVAEAALARARSGLLGFLVSDDPALLASLESVPLVVLVLFRASLLFLPAYVALMGYDQVSGEVGARSIRYVTVRARRSSLLVGKFLAQASVLLVLVLAVDVGVLVYARVTHEGFGLGAVALTLLRLGLATLVFSLAYLGLTALCSSLFRAPSMSLGFNLVLLLAFWLVGVVGEGARRLEAVAPGAQGEPLALLRFLSPSYYAADLLHPHPARFGASCAAYVAFALLFLAAAHAALRARDL